MPVILIDSGHESSLCSMPVANELPENESMQPITWTEISPPERIALLHGESRGDPNAFESVLTFEPAGAATRMEMRTVFPTKDLRDEVVEKYHAIEGGRQTLSNLAAYVTEIVRKGAED